MELLFCCSGNKKLNSITGKAKKAHFFIIKKLISKVKIVENKFTHCFLNILKILNKADTGSGRDQGIIWLHEKT
jgi:hypothetical protein